METYQKEFQEFLKQPGVTRHEKGGISYPSNLKVPERPAVLRSAEAEEEFRKKTLQILLDGRSEADLMKQIRSAYAKLAIRL